MSPAAAWRGRPGQHGYPRLEAGQSQQLFPGSAQERAFPWCWAGSRCSLLWMLYMVGAEGWGWRARREEPRTPDAEGVIFRAPLPLFFFSSLSFQPSSLLSSPSPSLPACATLSSFLTLSAALSFTFPSPPPGSRSGSSPFSCLPPADLRGSCFWPLRSKADLN